MRLLNNVFFSSVLGLLGLTLPVRAQQNLFNVPSGQITQPGALFVQQQLNLSRPVGTSNTTLDVGLGHGWEAGVNFLDALLYVHDPAGQGGQTQVNPDLLVNVQKGVKLLAGWHAGLGTQLGFNPARHRSDIKFINFSWLINAFSVPDHARFGTYYAGAYYANQAYAGPGNAVGFLLGAEIPVIPERLSVQADWVGGHNEISVIVLGGVMTFRKGWQLSLGVQIPSPGSPNPHGSVMEYTLPGIPVFSAVR